MSVSQPDMAHNTTIQNNMTIDGLKGKSKAAANKSKGKDVDNVAEGPYTTQKKGKDFEDPMTD